MSQHIHQFQLVKGRVVPREARWIETPIKESKETILSDLVPTDAVDDLLIASIGTATYGAIDFANKPSPNAFADYVLRRITPDRSHSGFSRMWFTRNVIPTEPFKILTWYDDHPWPPVLFGIAFFIDFSYPLFTRGPDGKYIYSPRYYPRIDYVDAQTEGTAFKSKHFVYTQPPTVKQYEAPMPTTVRYAFANIDETFQACLHRKMVLEPQITAYAAFSEVTGSTYPASGVASGQSFDATNFLTWDTYTKSAVVVEHDLLYEVILTEVTPPFQPKPSRG